MPIKSKLFATWLLLLSVTFIVGGTTVGIEPIHTYANIALLVELVCLLGGALYLIWK